MATVDTPRAAMVAAVQAAPDLAALRELYLDAIGLERVDAEGDPEAIEPEELRALLLEMAADL